MFKFLSRLEAIKPFRESEAWGLFRIAALAEAFGWTLLISGLLIHRYHLPGSRIAIPIAGQIHGTIFLGYFGALAAVYSSLGWPRKKFLLAVLAGVPPYGSLIFEQWAARTRHAEYQQIFLRNLLLAVIAAQ
jgi:integral membrane protein